jgi:hypothetical protein
MRSEFRIEMRSPRRSRKQAHASIKNEPVIRQYLVLAEQVKLALSDNPKRSMRDIAKWLGYSPARLSQIFKLTFIAAPIKKEILLSEEPGISSITVTAVCNIADEPFWEKQIDLWSLAKSEIKRDSSCR